MDLKEILNDYFASEEIPPQLHPRNINNILGVKSNSAEIPLTPQYEPETMQRAESPAKISEQAQPKTGASALIKVVRRCKLTGTEFLSLLGNTKISNSTYQEIKNNPSMTVKRLIELLEASPLTEEDYDRLTIAVERTAALKEEAEAKAARQAEAGLFIPKASVPASVDPAAGLYEEKSSAITATQIIREIDLEREAKNIIDRQSATESYKEHISKDYEDDGSARQSYNARVGSLKRGLETAGIDKIDEEAIKPPAYTHEDYISATEREESKDDYEEDEEEYEEEQPGRRLLFGMHGEDTEDDYEEDLDSKKRRDKKSRKKSEKAAVSKKIDKANDLDEEDEDYSRKPSKKKSPPSKKSYDEEEFEDSDEDWDDDDADYDDFGRRKKGSNKGKIIAAAIGAVLLIALSFGIRYYLTGSLLPSMGNDAVEEKLDEGGIFDQLFDLPPQTLPAFLPNEDYTAGRARSGKMLTNLLSLDKRLLYVSDNNLYIFEQIGGQLEKLAVKTYPEDTEVLGLIGDNSGIAVVIKAEDENYAFSCAVTGEDGADTVVNGTVQRTITQIDLLDPTSPEKASAIKTVKLSGDLTAIYKLDSRFTAVTWENIPDSAVKQDINTFMPYVVTDERKLCSAENVLITDKADHKSFASIYTIDFEGNTEIASVAGGGSQLVYRYGNSLFIGQGNTLARYDLSQGSAIHNGSAALEGGIANFSAVGVTEDEIRVTTLENGGAVLNIFDTELQKITQIKNIGENEVYQTTCFNGKETYIVAEGSKCYGIDAENNAIGETGTKITSSQLYPYNGEIGIRLIVLDDGQQRTGLEVSTVKLDGTMTEISTFEISSRTVAKGSLDQYISSPAEEDIFRIGSGEGTIVIPVVYFDGISQVEFFVICSVNNEGTISYCGNVSEYDRNSKNISAAVHGTNIIAFTEGKIITAKSENGNVIGYFNY